MTADGWHTARWVWTGDGPPREGAGVLVRDGRVVRVEHRPPAHEPARDLGEGLLLPGAVNAHTHLELSCLEGRLPPAGDFVGWVWDLVRLMRAEGLVGLEDAARTQALGLAETGTVLAGDITNSGRAMAAWATAGISALTFHENLGRSGETGPQTSQAWHGARYEELSLAAHAPYSIPSARIPRLKALAGDRPFAIHCAESAAEAQFFADRGEEGHRMADFLSWIPFDLAVVRPLAPTPLGHLRALGVLDARTLLVHGCHLDPADLEPLAASGASLCVCPRSNLGLAGRLAPVRALLARGVNLCLGTDSLASSPGLSVWDELPVLMAQVPGLDPAAALVMATTAGARALGLADHFGVIAPGAVAGLAFAPLDAARPDDALAALAWGQGSAPPRRV